MAVNEHADRRKHCHFPPIDHQGDMELFNIIKELFGHFKHAETHSEIQSDQLRMQTDQNRLIIELLKKICVQLDQQAPKGK
jgi:hypothetical protein